MNDFAPMVASIFIMLIPITVILTRHQQKMAAIMRQDHVSQHEYHDLQTVQFEVQQLKTMVASIAMSVDDLKNEVKSNSQLQERVKIQE